MSDLGEMLRRAREKKELTLAQVEDGIRIREKFLKALEEGDYDILPEEVYARGFVRSYAAYLGLDPEEALALYLEDRTPFQAAIPPPRPMSAPIKPMVDSPSPSASWLNPVWAIVIAAAIMVIACVMAGGLWAVRRYRLPGESVEAKAGPTLPAYTVIATEASPPSPTPGISVPFVPTDTPTPTTTPTVTPTPAPKAYTGVEIELVVREKAWLQVIVDGVKQFDGILEAGERRIFSGQQRVAVRCGNAGGVEVIVNGRSEGLMGGPGEVVGREWIKEVAPAEAPPAANLTPSPTATPTATPRVHVVQPGDNLWSISVRYGVTVEAVREANGLTEDSVLHAGDRLLIPAPVPSLNATPQG
jgi:cytoskeleton protein RodZ